ncbi:MAG: DUF2721 domain-containing protein [Tahibacter sp.]
MSSIPVDDIVHVIQLSVAPVFLLSGVGALLGVVTQRLARIVDRARRLEDRLEHVRDQAREEALDELRKLSRRARLMHWSISLVTACALLVAAVIVVLFAGAFLALNVGTVAAGMFVLAMLALCGGLIGFLREVYLATVHLRLGPG